jgi:Fe-S cluster biogenesis protein NfuA
VGREGTGVESLYPFLYSGGVELVGIDPEGVVHLRLEGSCDGCPSSTQTVKLAIERAIEEAAPEVTAVEVENPTRERRQQLPQIQPLYTECAVPAAAAGTETRR